MKSTYEPEFSGKTRDRSTSAPEWTYALDDTMLLEGRMTLVYPMGVNVLLVRVGGAVYAVSGKCAHMACPLSGGSLCVYVDGENVSL
jgi:nitrite reductase/ring-hydroxylating ferredoxin subunit